MSNGDDYPLTQPVFVLVFVLVLADYGSAEFNGL